MTIMGVTLPGLDEISKHSSGLGHARHCFPDEPERTKA